MHACSGLEDCLVLTLVQRNEELDFAILQSAHAYIETYQDATYQCPVELWGGEDLLLVIVFANTLGFTKASSHVLSGTNQHLFFACATFSGNSAAALILKDGTLVGIHQACVSALRERLQQAKTCGARLTASEESIDAVVNGGLAQGWCALLSHVFSGC